MARVDFREAEETELDKEMRRNSTESGGKLGKIS